uniref:Uncharacterized protein n=1 Tax=Solanum tuberosum TaxID=4113 RepID=M1DFJ5_SOLTU
MDHSASLVGITDQLSDSTFGVVHRRLAPTFSIVVLWVVGRHGTASQNCSSTRSFPSGLSKLEQKGKFARIFQSTFVSVHSRSKCLFKACDGAECKGMVI